MTLLNNPARRNARERISRRLLRRFIKNEKGTTAVEFGLLAIPFFLLLAAIVEIGLAFFVNRMLDYAVMESARLIKTGQAAEATMSASSFKDSVCTYMTSVLCNEDRFLVDVQSYDSFSDIGTLTTLVDDDGDLKTTSAYDIGAASSIVVVRVVYKWPLFTSILKTDAGDTSDGYRLLYSSAVFRNEPYPW